MKPPYKKDLIGDKTSWIEKIKPVKEAFISDIDFRPVNTLPAKHTLKAQSSMQTIFFAASFIFILYMGYLLEPFTATGSRHSTMLELLLIIIAVVAVNILLHYYFSNSYRSASPSLILTHTAFSYAGRTIPWADVIGIYSFNEVKKGGDTISSVKIRINTREVINIRVYYYSLDATKVPKLISAYKMNWDLQHTPGQDSEYGI